MPINIQADNEDSRENEVAVLSENGVQWIAILAGSYFFKPNKIRVRVGIPVELSVQVQKGIIPHAFVIQ